MQVRAHKRFDGSAGLLDLDFIFMFRVIDLDMEIKMMTLMVLYSRAVVRHSVDAGRHLYRKCSLYL